MEYGYSLSLDGVIINGLLLWILWWWWFEKKEQNPFFPKVVLKCMLSLYVILITLFLQKRKETDDSSDDGTMVVIIRIRMIMSGCHNSVIPFLCIWTAQKKRIWRASRHQCWLTSLKIYERSKGIKNHTSSQTTQQTFHFPIILFISVGKKSFHSGEK